MAKKTWIALTCLVVMLLGVPLLNIGQTHDEIIAELESSGWKFEFERYPKPRWVDIIFGYSLASKVFEEGTKDIWRATFAPWRIGSEPDLTGIPNSESLLVIKFIDAAISAQTLDHLEGFVGLQVLEFENCQLTSGSIQSVGYYSDLWSLSLGITNVTDSDLAEVATLSKLQSLVLDGANITDAGLASLTALRKLKNLWIRDTAVSSEGVSRFKVEAPWCTRVVWDGDDSGTSP